MPLFGRTFRYEERATKAIQEAAKKWANVEDITAALEWAIMHDPLIGSLINERGIRGFIYPGARSRNEPDIDVLYEESETTIIVHDLTFSDARAHYAGKA